MNVTVTRTIKATPEQVYEVWLDPKSPGGPWFSARPPIIDIKVDGLFYHVSDSKGRQFPHFGRFVALERGKHIEYTWMSPATRGLETTVTLDFRAVNGGTELVLVHTGLHDDDVADHDRGWSFIADCVVKRIER